MFPLGLQQIMIQIRTWQLINCVVSCIKIIVNATSHSIMFYILMRPLPEDQNTDIVLPVKEGPQLP